MMYNISTQQTFLVFQGVFKTSWRRLQRDTFHLPRRFQDVFQDVFKTCLQDVLQLCLQDVFKKSSRRLGRQKIVQKQPSTGVLRKRCSEYMQQIYRRSPMPKCDFNKVTLQLYWNCTSAWVISCKLAAYFQNTFS